MLVIFLTFTITQISIAVTSSFLIIVYTNQYLPFKDNLLNKIEICNEIFILFFSYFVLAFVMLDAEPTLRYEIGEYYMIGLLTVLGVNVLFIIYISFWLPGMKWLKKRKRRN